MNTRQLLSVGIDIGTTTTQVIFSHLELVNRAAVSQVPRYEFIKREISWQSPVFFTPVDKQGGLKEAELKTLILEQYQAAGIAPESVDSGAIIITGESAKTRNARPAVMTLSQSLGDFVVASAGPHLESVIAGHGAGAQTLSEQRLCRVLNIDIGGGTANYALFDAGKISGTACLNVGGRLLETDSQGRVVYAHKPGQMIVDECFGPGTDARSLTGAQLAQVTRRMAELIVEVIDGTLSPLAQALMQTGLLPAGVTPEIITLSGGVGECYRHQPADPFCFADIGPLLATAQRQLYALQPDCAARERKGMCTRANHRGAHGLRRKLHVHLTQARMVMQRRCQKRANIGKTERVGELVAITFAHAARKRNDFGRNTCGQQTGLH